MNKNNIIAQMMTDLAGGSLQYIPDDFFAGAFDTDHRHNTLTDIEGLQNHSHSNASNCHVGTDTYIKTPQRNVFDELTQNSMKFLRSVSRLNIDTESKINLIQQIINSVSDVCDKHVNSLTADIALIKTESVKDGVINDLDNTKSVLESFLTSANDTLNELVKSATDGYGADL